MLFNQLRIVTVLANGKQIFLFGLMALWNDVGCVQRTLFLLFRNFDLKRC